MTTQRYTVTPYAVDSILSLIKLGEIAIPEIQRPFVWKAVQVRNLLDSLFQGFPIGFLIAWKNPTVKLKDGTSSAGKRILIDGQQRVTALMAAILGREVLTKNYRKVHIRIAFHPQKQTFEVSNPAIRKDATWVPNVAEVFADDFSTLQCVREYCSKNPGVSDDATHAALERLRQIVTHQIGVIELSENLDIDTVTNIFIRVNSAGATLSQADFAMSKIASNETFGGNQLRKAIDHFCHLAVAPEFHSRIQKADPEFAASDYFQKMSWLKDAIDDIYDPSYTDMLRVAFTSEFKRGKLQDLVALLSGRNFETKQYEEAIAEASFQRLGQGILRFINKTNFENLVMILKSAGFISSRLILGQNAVNSAYILFLRGRADKLPAHELGRLVARWFVFSLLTGRYTGNLESAIDFDIRQIDSRGLSQFLTETMQAELTEDFWKTQLPQYLETSSPVSPYFLAYQAAQVKSHDKGFLSRDISIQDLILNHCDVHHVYPRNMLKKQGLTRGQYNQIANLVVAQSEINIAIGDRPPMEYFATLAHQCEGGKQRYGAIDDLDQMRSNLDMNCIPVDMLNGEIPDYNGFLAARRGLIASKLKSYFESL